LLAPCSCKNFEGSHKNLQERLEREKISFHPNELYGHYQPIYHLKKDTLFGYESLLRHKKDIPPNELFDIARAESKVNELDKMAMKNGILTYSKTALEKHLFVNVLPSTLLQDDFSHFLQTILQETNLNTSKLVFELSETVHEAQFWDTAELQRVVSSLRQKGFSIAIDDVGSGIACNQKLIEFEPEFIKLDRYFGIGLSKSKLKQRTVESYLFLTEGHASLILEGIETQEDAEVAKQLGVELGQGFFYGRPESISSQCAR
jgi:EAL domain-containing protein (putative c-di-GMP-specific phosphodiesterase class I)